MIFSEFVVLLIEKKWIIKVCPKTLAKISNNWLHLKKGDINLQKKNSRFWVADFLKKLVMIFNKFDDLIPGK